MTQQAGNAGKKPARRQHPLFRSLPNLHKKLGAPPGTPVYTGSSEPGKTSYAITLFRGKDLDVLQAQEPSEFLGRIDEKTKAWIDVSALHEIHEITQLCDHFGIHPLLQEDIVSVGQLPKYEEFVDYIYFSLKMPYFVDERNQVEFEHISFILTEGQLLSFQEFSLDIFSPVRNRLIQNSAKLQGGDLAHLLALMIDTIVDHYYRIIDRYNSSLNELEDELLGNPNNQFVERVLGAKKQVSWLLRYAQPLREALRQMIVGRMPGLPESNQPYLRDTLDHLRDILDSLAVMQDMLVNYVNLYNSILSNRLGEVMKTLTIISTVFIPLTFLAGLYGMNFVDMPELQWKYGYPAILLLMAIVAIFMVLFIRRRKWM